MPNTLRDLFRHEAWADAEHLRAILAHPAASTDPELLERLNHIHLVQRWYLALFQGAPVAHEALRPLASTQELCASTALYHAAVPPLFDNLDPARLDLPLDLPGFPQFQPLLREAMLQVVMHSQHHRAQNARRLRELGGQPPMTDYLLWAMRGRPDPALTGWT